MEDNELLADFVVEANEHLSDIENQFLAIEQAAPDVDAGLVNEVFRAIHSIKGAAGFLGLRTVNDLAHNLENVLNMMRNEELAPSSAIVDDMLKGADALKGLIDDVENSNTADVSQHIEALERIAAAAMQIGSEPADGAPQPADEPAAEADAAPAPPADAAPTDEELEAAINAKLAEKLGKGAAEAQPPAQAAPAPQPEAPPPRPAADKPAASDAAASKPQAEAQIRVAVGVLDSLMNLAGELVLSRNQLLQAVSSQEKNGLDAISARIDQITSELQEAIMQTRMQQIGTVFGRFPRVVRDLSSKLGKQLRPRSSRARKSKSTRRSSEAIGDPLTHLVRNSVDHGVESPEQRVARQRASPPPARLTLQGVLPGRQGPDRDRGRRRRHRSQRS